MEIKNIYIAPQMTVEKIHYPHICEMIESSETIGGGNTEEDSEDLAKGRYGFSGGNGKGLW